MHDAHIRAYYQHLAARRYLRAVFDNANANLALLRRWPIQFWR